MQHSERSTAVSGHSPLERDGHLMSRVVHLRNSYRAGALVISESEGCVFSKTLDPSRVYAVVRTGRADQPRAIVPGVYQSWVDDDYEVLGGVYSHSRFPCWYISKEFEFNFRSDELVIRLCELLELTPHNLVAEDAIWLMLQIMG